MIATLWLAPGVLLRNDYVVPNPPPFTFYIAIYSRPATMWTAPTSGPMPVTADIHKAEFRLAEHSTTSGVAHYELRSMPPTGYRWLAVNGRLRAERIR